MHERARNLGMYSGPRTMHVGWCDHHLLYPIDGEASPGRERSRHARPYAAMRARRHPGAGRRTRRRAPQRSDRRARLPAPGRSLLRRPDERTDALLRSPRRMWPPPARWRAQSDRCRAPVPVPRARRSPARAHPDRSRLRARAAPVAAAVRRVLFAGEEKAGPWCEFLQRWSPPVEGCEHV